MLAVSVVFLQCACWEVLEQVKSTYSSPLSLALGSLRVKGRLPWSGEWFIHDSQFPTQGFRNHIGGWLKCSGDERNKPPSPSFQLKTKGQYMLETESSRMKEIYFWSKVPALLPKPNWGNAWSFWGKALQVCYNISITGHFLKLLVTLSWINAPKCN